MILLFATSKRDLFKRDLLNVTAFKNGERIFFSYGKRFVDLNHLPNLKGEDAVIVFAEFINRSTEYIFHPIRYVIISDVIYSNNTSTILLALEMKDLIKYDESTMRNRTITFNQECSLLPNIPSTLRGNNYNAHFIIRHQPAIINNFQQGIGYTSWINLVMHLAQTENLKDCLFFTQSDNAPKGYLKLHQLRRRSNEELILKGNHVYTLSFNIYPPKTTSNTQNKHLQISTNENILVYGPEDIQNGSDFISKFKFVTKSTITDVYSAVIVKSSIENEEPISPKINYIVKIKPKGIYLYPVMLCFIIGLAAPLAKDFFYDNKIYCSFLGCMDGDQCKIWVAIIGIVSIAISGVLAFKKLPIGG